ncbi:mucin-2 isoform X3 [Cherax quadricarinatus]|uniref:mucin-2 isoform X3 n=1 Tax=Cherax quadricarinatus TaxID=27406 RepID=UPI00387E9E2C
MWTVWLLLLLAGITPAQDVMMVVADPWVTPDHHQLHASLSPHTHTWIPGSDTGDMAQSWSLDSETQVPTRLVEHEASGQNIPQNGAYRSDSLGDKTNNDTFGTGIITSWDNVSGMSDGAVDGDGATVAGESATEGGEIPLVTVQSVNADLVTNTVPEDGGNIVESATSGDEVVTTVPDVMTDGVTPTVLDMVPLVSDGATMFVTSADDDVLVLTPQGNDVTSVNSDTVITTVQDGVTALDGVTHGVDVPQDAVTDTSLIQEDNVRQIMEDGVDRIREVAAAVSSLVDNAVNLVHTLTDNGGNETSLSDAVVTTTEASERSKMEAITVKISLADSVASTLKVEQQLAGPEIENEISFPSLSLQEDQEDETVMLEPTLTLKDDVVSYIILTSKVLLEDLSSLAPTSTLQRQTISSSVTHTGDPDVDTSHNGISLELTTSMKEEVTVSADDSATENDEAVNLEDTYDSVMGEDYELIVETVVNTATVYYDDESLQHHSKSASHRFPRTVSADLRATPAHLNEVAVTEQYRSFPSLLPADDFATFMGGDSRLPTDLRKSMRKSEPEPDIDDIIKGIVQLLGGNVKMTVAEAPNTRLTTFADISSTRINNRGPPRLTQLPFGVLSSPVHTLLPVRPPVTPPVNMANLRPLPGKPQFVANTLPPFLAALPPSLSSRPPPPLQRPYVTGIPLPVDLLPGPDEVYNASPEITVNPVFQDYGGEDSLQDVPSGYTHPITAPPTTPIITPPATPIIAPPATTATAPPATTTTAPPATTATAPPATTATVPPTTTATAPPASSNTASPSTTDTATPTPTTAASSETLLVDHLMSDATVTHTTRTTLVSELSNSVSTQVTHAYTSVSTEVTDAYASVLAGTTDAATSASTGFPDVSSTSTGVDASESTSRLVPVSWNKTETLESTKELHSSMPESSSTIIRWSLSTPDDLHHTSTTAPTDALWSTSPRPSIPPDAAPRPGVVLDDPQYRPGHVITGTVVPYDVGGPGDIFDVTVSAHQGFGPPVAPFLRPTLAQPFPIPGLQEALVTTPADGAEGFVSIDGRKTYFDLFPTAATNTYILPQQQTAGLGVGVVIPEGDLAEEGGAAHDLGYYPPTAPLLPRPLPTPTQPPPRPLPPTQPPPRPQPPIPTQPPPRAQPPRPIRKPYNRRPTQPSIRIDTCIVGDDSTCQEQLGEVCRTEDEVSSCYCRPGTARRRPRTPCRRMISLQVSLKVDRVGDQRIVWGGNYENPESEEYRLLQWEARHAISSTMSKTPLGSAYLGNTVHKFYSLGGKVIVNSTINLEDLPSTRSRSVRQALQRQMIQVIQNHANNIGESALWVDGPLNPIPDVSDVNECFDESLYDCHPDATCINEFGTFTCRCLPGYTDRFADDAEQVGRRCESCSSDYCNKRGECAIKEGHKLCQCRGSYYGTRCEIDGEVLGVAVGASVAAVVIIILTLIFLCMWSRRWKAEDRKTEVLARGGGIGGFAVNVQHKGASAGHQYGATLDDRMRWAHLADTLSSQNIYAQQQQQQYGGGAYTATSSDYLTLSGTSTTPFSIYNRVTRALSSSTLGRRQMGWLGRIRRALGGSRMAKSHRSTHTLPEQQTLTLQQLMALHAQLSPQPEQLRGGLGSVSASPSATAAAPTTVYQHQRQAVGSSSGYASLGTLGSTASPQYSHQYQPSQQFGLQHLSPVTHLTSMQQQQQQQQQQYHKQSAFSSQSTYGQFGPASFNTLSQGGVSRAPTLGARTPLPLHDVGGPATIGPMGGGSVAPSGLAMGLESSEEEVEKPYHLPRPKSRVSLGDTSDIYYEPDDLITTLGPPDRPPPPLPKSSHPQTYNFAFLH